MAASLKIEGIPQLNAAFEELGKLKSRSALTRVLVKAGKPMADRANDLAPDDPETAGGLKGSYISGTKLNARQKSLAKKEPKDFATAYVGTNDPAGIQQEFGNVNHGPQAHLRPAFEQEADATIDRIAEGLKPELDKTVARARAKALKAA